MNQEQQQSQLKQLIAKGKAQGYLTYAEVNDHLPSDIMDPEQIDDIIGMINDMGISVHDEAPDAEALLMSDTATAVTDEDVVEEAEAALSNVDSEFGRTTDPVRMYMREMGSVELLTRESEIEIAKRIEGGLRHMIQAISACPPIIGKIVDLATEVEKDVIRIDEVVDGLLDANAQEITNEEFSEESLDQELASSDLGDEDEDEGEAIDKSLLIVVPSITPQQLNGWTAEPSNRNIPGIYDLPPAFCTTIVAIAELPSNPDTLWLRLLGRGLTQRQAIVELMHLKSDYPFRTVVLQQFKQWEQLLLQGRMGKESKHLMQVLSQIDINS